MISNQKKAEYYAAMRARIEQNWIKGQLDNYQGGVCLVGAVQAEVTPRDQDEMQLDLLALIRRKSLIAHGFADTMQSDGGYSAIEWWNDTKWRRKSQVVKMLDKQARRYAKLAQEDREVHLTYRVSTLQKKITEQQMRIQELEAENLRLIEEVSWWKARRAKVTARELVTANNEFAELDSQLDAAARELETLQVN